MGDIEISPTSTDELTVQVVHDRFERPYLALTDDEGNEIAAVSATVDQAGILVIEFDQYGDCGARFEVVEHAGYTPNKTIWRTGYTATSGPISLGKSRSVQ